MGQEMEQMHQMLMHVNQSVEVQDTKRKDFEAQMNAGAEHLAMEYVKKNIAAA